MSQPSATIQLTLAIGIILSGCGGGQTARVPPGQTPTAPNLASPDAQFNQLFTQNGPGWTGGDSTYSIRLAEGRTLWMFSDSYIGTVDPATRLRASYLFQARNSMMIQDAQNNLITLCGGTVANPTSLFTPGNAANWFWVGGAAIVEPSPGTPLLKLFLLEFTSNIQFVGNSVATLTLPDLTITGVTSLQLPTTVEWGSSLLPDGTWIYVYGIEDLGVVKYPHVARTAPDQIANPSNWEFWNGTSWVPGMENSVRLISDSISNEFSVSLIDGVYLLVAMDTEPAFGTWKDIVTYSASNPYGPWGNRKVIYSTPETGEGHQITYDPRAHPEFNANDRLLVSYNVNSLVPEDLVNADIYRPRFVRVPLQLILALTN